MEVPKYLKGLAPQSRLETTTLRLIAKDYLEGKKNEAAGKLLSNLRHTICGYLKRNRFWLLNASNRQSLWGPKTIAAAG